MHLSTLLSAVPGLQPQAGGNADPEITRVTADSRQVAPGALFVAVHGDQVDGRRFIPDALARGAAVIVAEGELSFPFARGSASEGIYLAVPDSRAALGWLSAAWHGFPSRQLVLIGVTGTDGKTTTASLIHAILQAAGLKAGLISTVNAVIGGETLDTGFHVTTPDAPEVQGYLAQMVKAGLTHCVLEVTSHGLAQRRVTGCDFDVAVVTNVTHEHLDYHKTYENYLAAKGQLFEMLSGSARKPGTAKAGVLNFDDSSYDYLASVLHETRLAYSLSRPVIQSSDPQAASPNVWASEVADSPASLAFRAVGESFDFPVTTPLVGRFNVSNCLAAITATVGALGLPPEAAQKGLAEFAGVPGRMERIDLGQPFTALVDFAHTPNALQRALESARQMITGAGGRVIAVFGSAGLRDVRKRWLMAEVSAELADITILTAEDPRTESLEGILEMMAEGARSKGAVEQSPKSEVRSPKSEVQSPKSEVQSPKSKVRSPKSEVQSPKSEVQSPKSEVRSPKSEVQSPESKIQNPKSEIQNQNPPIFYRVPDRAEALRLAVALAQPGDLVIACGKGHEQSMCFGAVEYPWDDRTAMRAALAERLGVSGPEMPK